MLEQGRGLGQLVFAETERVDDALVVGDEQGVAAPILRLIGAVALWILALGNFTFPAYILLPLALFGGVYLILFRRDCLRRLGLWRNLGIMFGVGILLIVPFYLPLLADLVGPSRPAYLPLRATSPQREAFYLRG